MININEKIKELNGYFLGMNVAEGFIYITVRFPEEWKISSRINEKYDVRTVKTENGLGYYFYTSMDVGFDNVFGAIEDTIEFNEMALQKQELFMAKIQELQLIFEDEPLDVLKTIEFKYKKKRNKKVVEENEEKEVEPCQAG